MNQHLTALARKFPQTKFLRSVSSVCIPNYPDKNLPTVFVYRDSDMKKQYVGPLAFGGMNITQNGKKMKPSGKQVRVMYTPLNPTFT